MPALPPARNLLAVAAGGAVGALARVALATWFPPAEGAWPWVTFAENVLGAFLLGLLLTLLVERLSLDPVVRLLAGTGALGAFTTYSTLAVETDALLRGGRPGLAVAYGLVSTVYGLVAALAGMRLARWRPADGHGDAGVR